MFRLLCLLSVSVAVFGQTSTYVAGSRVFEGGVNFLGNDTGSDNTYTVTSSTDPYQKIKGYHQGSCYSFRSTHDNSGAATINIDGIGSSPLKRIGGADLGAADIKNDTLIEVCRNGSYFQVMNVAVTGNADVGASGLINSLPVQMYQSVADYGLSTWTAAFNNAANQVVNVVLFSDSIGVCYQPACGGQGATSASLRYAEQLKTYFESKGVSHGTGLKPLQISVSGNVLNSTYWITSGTWAQSSLIGPTQTTSGGGQTGSSLAKFNSGASATFLSQKYDHLNVYCATNSSSTGFSVVIDGNNVGNACSSTTGSATAQVFTFNTSGLTSHVAVLTALGNNSYLFGAEGTIGSSGVSVHMVGQAGAVAEMFGVNPNSQAAFTDILPGGTHLAIIAFGTNEPISNVDVPTFTTSMSNLITHEKALTGSPSVLVFNSPPNGYTPSATTLPAYWTAAKTLAISTGSSYLSPNDRWVNYATAAANGLIQDDTVHLTNKGNNEMRAMIGKQIFGLDPGALPSGNGGLLTKSVTIQATDNFPQLVVQGVPGYVFGVASSVLIPSDDFVEWRWYAWGNTGGDSPGLLQLVNGKNDHSPLFINGDAAHHSAHFTHSGMTMGDMSAIACDSGGEGALSYVKGSGSTKGELSACINDHGTIAWSPIGGAGSGSFTGGTITGQTTVQTTSGFPQFNIHGDAANTSGVAGFNMSPADNTASWSWYSWGTNVGNFSDRLLQLVNGSDDSTPFYVEHDAKNKALGLTNDGLYVQGKVGIGVEAPAWGLDIRDPSLAVAQIWNTDDTHSGGSYILFMSGTTGANPNKKYVVSTANASNGSIMANGFSIRDESDGTARERVFVGSGGRVAIGGSGNAGYVGGGTEVESWRTFGLYADEDGLTINSPNQSSSCDANHRFLERTVPGSSGVADKVQYCLKDSSDNYSFVDK